MKVKRLDETPHQILEGSSSCIVSTLGTNVIQTHILSRLDDATLAVLSCVSSQLRPLCSDEQLWRKVCTATWPSLPGPTFPGDHRSFSYPSPSPPPAELICAVDLYCQQGPGLFSRVGRINTTQDDIFEVSFSEAFIPLDPPPVSANYKELLEENLRLSWFLIDPSQNRVANLLSSCKPVSVQPSIPGYAYDFTAVYRVMMTGDVESRVKVECSWIPWNPLRNVVCIKRVRMEMWDMMNGFPVIGEEAFMILQTAMQSANKNFHDYLRRTTRNVSMSRFNYYHNFPRKIRFRPRKISASASNSKKKKNSSTSVVIGTTR